jgi:hypothetical protein
MGAWTSTGEQRQFFLILDQDQRARHLSVAQDYVRQTLQIKCLRVGEVMSSPNIEQPNEMEEGCLWCRGYSWGLSTQGVLQHSGIIQEAQHAGVLPLGRNLLLR